MTTINELNRAICEAMWGVNKETSPYRWSVPIDSPWFRDWDLRPITETPDFIRDPAEAWRLMVWIGGGVVKARGKWRALTTDGVAHNINNDDPAVALALAFLASKGVQATPPEDAWMPNDMTCKKCGHDLKDHAPPCGCEVFGCDCDRSCCHDTNVSPEQERADALQTALDLMATLYWASVRCDNEPDALIRQLPNAISAVLNNPPAKEAYEKARGA